MYKEKAIDYQFIRPVEVGTSAMKGKVPLRSLFKEYFRKLNVGFYDPCCDDDATCPPISSQEGNTIECLSDGLFSLGGSSSGEPAGENEEIQFNNNGVFGSSDKLKYTGDLTKVLRVGSTDTKTDIGDAFITLSTTDIFISPTITISNTTGSLTLIAGISGKNTISSTLPFFLGNSDQYVKTISPLYVGTDNSLTTPEAVIHITHGNTILPQLKFNQGGLIGTPVDGAMEYDGTDLYFTIGSTRSAVTLAASSTTFYIGDGTILGPRTVNVDGYSITWNNTGLFRIVNGDVTIGGTYDFTTGVDLLVYNATNSSNLILDPLSGMQFSYTDLTGPTVLSSLGVNTTGINLTGIQEFADNAAALLGGLTTGYLYRTGDILKIVH